MNAVQRIFKTTKKVIFTVSPAIMTSVSIVSKKHWRRTLIFKNWENKLLKRDQRQQLQQLSTKQFKPHSEEFYQELAPLF